MGARACAHARMRARIGGAGARGADLHARQKKKTIPTDHVVYWWFLSQGLHKVFVNVFGDKKNFWGGSKKTFFFGG